MCLDNRTYCQTDTAYARLLRALNLGPGPDDILFISRMANALDLKISQISSYLKNGQIASPEVLEAVRKKGINPDYILLGKKPMYLPGHNPEQIAFVNKGHSQSEVCPVKNKLEEALRLLESCGKDCPRRK